MGKEIRAVDGRGYVVSCSAAYWESHVLRRHPDLQGHEDDARRAIEESRPIFASKTAAGRCVYYGRLTGRSPEIKVVVAFDANNVGLVVSVSACSRRPGGEAIIWP